MRYDTHTHTHTHTHTYIYVIRQLRVKETSTPKTVSQILPTNTLPSFFFAHTLELVVFTYLFVCLHTNLSNKFNHWHFHKYEQELIVKFLLTGTKHGTATFI